MNKEFIPYEQALELKELGYNKPCLDFYDDNQELFYNVGDKGKVHIGIYVEAPLYQQAFRWFREKHKLSSWVYNSDVTKYFYTILHNGRIIKANESVITYEDAELACLNKLIQIVKEKKL